jgi:large subunit ribosomal protein L29
VKQSTREYVGLPVHELESRLHDAQDELAQLRFQLATRKVSNYARLAILRKDIARLKFFIDIKQRGE